MRHRVRSVSRHGERDGTTADERSLIKARRAFVECRGLEAAGERAVAIAFLPSKDWKGRKVYRLTCEGPFGNGPHEVWKPEWLLWALHSLDHFICPFHS